jgi:hypothetical protein
VSNTYYHRPRAHQKAALRRLRLRLCGRYMVINNRLLLVDPPTGIVVAEVTD